MAFPPRGHAQASPAGGPRARGGAGRPRTARAGGGAAHAARLARLQALRYVRRAHTAAV